MPEDTARHPDDTLILVEINLANYSASVLSEHALSGIQSLFDMLRSSGCGLIVRFLYDWSGRNIITEPKSVDIILGHIGQLTEDSAALFISELRYALAGHTHL
jgi:hypothetical protein